MAAHHAELVGRFAALSERSSGRRLAATLLYLDRRLGQGCSLAPGRRISLPQERVAEVANLARQTTNRCLNRFQSAGLVRLERGMVCLLDAEATEKVARGLPLPTAARPPGPCRYIHPREPLTCYPIRRSTGRRAHR